MTTMPPQEIAERVLELARCDECMVILTEESSANIRWAGNELTTDGVMAGRRLTVVATAGGGKVGVVSQYGAVHDLEGLVRRAEQTAREAPPAEDASPFVPGDGTAPDWVAPVPVASVAELAAVRVLGDAFAAARSRGHLLFGYAEDRTSATFLASSTGLRLRADATTRHIELTGKSADRSRSAWAAAAGERLTEADVAGVCDQVDQRLRWALRQLQLEPGRYETLLPPAAVADLMNYVYASAGARDTVEGRTVFSAPGGGTRLGERLTDLPLTLRGDPFASGLACPPFVLTHSSDGAASIFDNGLPLQPTRWIDRGVLGALRHTRHSAELTGSPITPHIDNLILSCDDVTASLEDMVRTTKRGLLLTSLWYIREVDLPTLLLTGLTRDGVYLVEQGEVIGAVRNFRFNESPVDMLRRVREAGVTAPTRAREWFDAFAHTAMPPLRVDGFNMSSVSAAV